MDESDSIIFAPEKRIKLKSSDEKKIHVKQKKLLTKAFEFGILSELRPTRKRGRREH